MVLNEEKLGILTKLKLTHHDKIDKKPKITLVF